MKEYIITYTYQVSIKAKNEDEAMNKANDLFDKEIVDGNMYPEVDIIEKNGGDNQ